MRTRRTVIGLFITFAAGAALVLGSSRPASADLLDDILSGPGGVVGPVVGGAGGVLCQAAGDTPGLGEVFCTLEVASVQYRTTFRRPDGSEIVRTVNGVATLPSLLNVDDDLLPDISAQLTVHSLNTFSLTVQRAPLETGPVPVKVELIVKNPSKVATRKNIYFGFDARQGQLPTKWVGKIVLAESSLTKTTIGLKVDRTGPASSLALVGGMFNGTPDVRTDPLAATVETSPVPSTLAAGLTIFDDDASDHETLSVEAGANVSTNAKATIEDSMGTTRSDVTASINNLKNLTSVVIDKPTSTEKTVTYASEDRLPQVKVLSELRDAGTLTDRMQVQLDDLPTGIVYHQPAPGAGTLSTTGGPIGTAQVAIGSGGHTPTFPVETGQHFFFDYAGDFDAPEPAPGAPEPPPVPNAMDLKLERLTAATFSTDGDVDVDVTTVAPPAGQTRPNLRGLVRDLKRVVDATVYQMPNHAHVLATKAGVIDYDGFGSTVPKITANLTALSGTLGEQSRYTQADATVLDLPAEVTVAVSPDKNHIVADAGEIGVGSLQVHARDNHPSTCLSTLGANAGAAVVDVPARACVAARFDGLKSADVQVEPIKLDVKARNPQFLTLRATLDDAGDDVVGNGTLVADIANAPSEFAMAQDGGLALPFAETTDLSVRSNGVIDTIQVTGANLPESFPARYLSARVLDLPEKIDISLPLEGSPQRITASAPDTITEVKVRMSSTPDDCLNRLADESGVVFVDTPAVQCAGFRVLSLRDALIELAPLRMEINTRYVQPFELHATIDDPLDGISTPGTLDGRIYRLPTHTSIEESVVPVALDPSSTVRRFTVTGQPAITELTLTGSNLPEPFPARGMDIELSSLPEHLTLELPESGGAKQFRVDTGEQGLGYAKAVLADDATAFEPKPDTDQVVVKPGLIAVQVHDIDLAELITPVHSAANMAGTVRAQVNHSAPAKDLEVSVEQSGITLEVILTDVPQNLSFEKTGRQAPGVDEDVHPDLIKLHTSPTALGSVHFLVDQGTPSLIHVDAHDLPRTLDLCVWNGNGGLYSAPDAVSKSWCYNPFKKSIEDGGDPFTVFDKVQVKISTPGTPEKAIKLDRLLVKSDKGSGHTSTTDVREVAVGNATIAFGSGAINPVLGQASAMQNLYKDLLGVNAEESKGLHLYLDTDIWGIKGLLDTVYNDPGSDDPTGFTYLTIREPLHAEDKITVLDMDNSPGPSEEYQRGVLYGCSLNPAIFRVTTDVGPLDAPLIIVGAILRDYLNCAD